MGMVYIKHIANTMLALRQGNDSLRDFANKFTKIMNDVTDLDTGIAIVAYTQLYIEMKELNKDKIYDDLESHIDPRRNKKPHFDTRRYTDRETLLETSLRYTTKDTMLESSHKMVAKTQQQGVPE